MITELGRLVLLWGVDNADFDRTIGVIYNGFVHEMARGSLIQTVSLKILVLPALLVPR